MEACLKGNLAIVKTIYFANPTIGISAREDDAFRMACYFGHLSVAQWLFSMKPTIDISARVEEIVRYIFRKGYLLFGQWLLSVKPTIDISARDDEAFRMACFYDHTSLAQWLVTLKPFLYTIRINNRTGTLKHWHVRVAEHARWQNRKYALWLRSPKVCHSANVFCKIPEDVSRYIVQMFL